MKLKQYNAQCVTLICRSCGEVRQRRDGRYMSLHALQHIKDIHCGGRDIQWIHENAMPLAAKLCYMERIVAWELVDEPQVNKDPVADSSEGEE